MNIQINEQLIEQERDFERAVLPELIKDKGIHVLEDTQYKENIKAHEFYSFPIWDNVLCYFEQAPKIHHRLTPWKEIGQKLNLNNKQLDQLKKLYDLADCKGYLPPETFKGKHRKQDIQKLVQNNIICTLNPELGKRREGFLLNPCVLWAREWWSPWAQGGLAMMWMNEIETTLPVLHRYGFTFDDGAKYVHFRQ